MIGRRRQPEKTEQAAIVRLLRGLGASVYVLGTHRRRGDYPGTMQTPGISDLVVFLPRERGVLFVEVKAPKGRLRPEQAEFRRLCLACLSAQVHHVVGGLDAVIGYLIGVGLLKSTQVAHYRAPENQMEA